MTYADLDKGFKAKVNGSLSSMLRGNYDSFEEVYKDFLDRKIFATGEGFYYNEKPFKDYDEHDKVILDLKEEYKLDLEFLKDIKRIIQERFEKKMDLNKEKERSFEEHMKNNKATDKQKRYASKLYKQVHGEKKEFSDKEYSMQEMSDIIQDLLRDISGMGKVIEVDFTKPRK